MLTIIMGRTCSGKSTIVKELKKYGFHSILTTTTRPIRNGETQDVDYHFISEKEFLKKVEQNFFTEYKAYNTKFGTWYYGSAREDIERAGNNDIIILTPDGYRDVIKEYPNLEHRLVYIYTNNKTIKNRLMKRGDKKEEAERRLKQDYTDFRGVENLADRIVYNNENDKIDDVVDKLRSYLEENC